MGASPLIAKILDYGHEISSGSFPFAWCPPMAIATIRCSATGCREKLLHSDKFTEARSLFKNSCNCGPIAPGVPFREWTAGCQLHPDGSEATRTTPENSISGLSVFRNRSASQIRSLISSAVQVSRVNVMRRYYLRWNREKVSDLRGLIRRSQMTLSSCVPKTMSRADNDKYQQAVMHAEESDLESK